MKSFSYFVSEHLTHFLRDREIITAEYNSAYIYCFEFIFSNLFFICGILLCGILFTKPVFSVVFLLTLLPMRSFCGGVHAPNRLLCSVLSYLTYFISYILYLWMEGISSSQPVLFVLFLVLLILLNMTGPAETSARTYTHVQQNKMRSACHLYSVLLCLTFILLLQLHFPLISTMIFVCMIITTISVLLGKEKTYVSKRRNLRG